MESNTKSEKIKIDPRWAEVEQSHGYKLKEMLGEGSFGQVFRAKNKLNKQQYAVKLVTTPFDNVYQAR